MTTRERQRWHEYLDALIDGRLRVAENGGIAGALRPSMGTGHYSIAPKTIEAWAAVDNHNTWLYLEEKYAKNWCDVHGGTVVKLSGQVEE